MSDQSFDPPFKSAIQPKALDESTELRFRCYKGISCFNACCESADVTLTPYDILRLKTRLGLGSREFLARYTVPFQMDGDGTPGVKLKTTDTGTCLLLDGAQGCRIYEDRPTVCRYYPVALLTIRPAGTSKPRRQYSLVEEEHCKGHEEPHTQTIGDYRRAQGCEEYDEHNQAWYELILKKKSTGPTVGKPPQTSLNLFFMASYDLDTFRRFVLSDKFQGTYDLPQSLYEELARDDLALLAFAARFLRQVLFAERSIPEREGAWEQRVAQRREIWDARREAERARRLQEEDRKYKGDDEIPG